MAPLIDELNPEAGKWHYYNLVKEFQEWLLDINNYEGPSTIILKWRKLKEKWLA